MLGDLDDEAEVREPLCVLQGRVPLAALTGETESAQCLITLPHSMDVRDVQVSQLGSRVVRHILSSLPLEALVES